MPVPLSTFMGPKVWCSLMISLQEYDQHPCSHSFRACCCTPPPPCTSIEARISHEGGGGVQLSNQHAHTWLTSLPTKQHGEPRRSHHRKLGFHESEHSHLAEHVPHHAAAPQGALPLPRPRRAAEQGVPLPGGLICAQLSRVYLQPLQKWRWPLHP